VKEYEKEEQRMIEKEQRKENERLKIQATRQKEAK